MQTILLAFIIALSSPTPGSHSCFCAVPDVPEALDKAKAVFVGEVLEIVEPTTSDEKALLPGRFYIVRFKVEKSWKGVLLASEIDVLSDQGRGCFAYPAVSKGEKHLVYADAAFENAGESKEFKIMTNCNRTALLPTFIRRFTQLPPSSEKTRRDGTDDLEMLDAIITMGSKPKRIY